jgi:hypothetical protein
MSFGLSAAIALAPNPDAVIASTAATANNVCFLMSFPSLGFGNCSDRPARYWK